MKAQKLAVWLSLLAGVLFLIGGLRDIFAPGFFNISPQVKEKADIAFQFFAAVTFFAVAYVSSLNRADPDRKK